jgi:hypothetical protein
MISPAMPRTAIATLDRVLEAHARDLADDFAGYRNHAYRVANLCLALVPGAAGQVNGDAANPDTVEKVAVAAAFHDLGIWTDRTFDYLQPSMTLAATYLRESGKPLWTDEIAAMILEHHKVRPYRSDAWPLVEPFRRADWIDVTRGLLTLGARRSVIARLYAMWPSAGFHRRLVQLEVGRLRTHPWSPLPMLRL